MPPIDKESTSNAFEEALTPDEFDSRTFWKSYIHPIKDQDQCGSYWAFAASEALSDRFAIASSGAIDEILSPEYMIACDLNNFGCKGGDLNSAWNFLKSNGIPTEKCVSYKSGRGSVAACPDKCDDGSAMKLYKVQNVSTASNSQEIMNAIYTGGPIEVGFMVFEDFMNYKSGIYQHISGSQLGGHAVKAIGWGVDAKVGKYWILANSWTETWGEQGFFRVKFGECSVEKYGVYGAPFIETYSSE